MYSIDRRAIAINIYNELQSLRKTAKLLQVCHTTVYRWLKNPMKQQRKVNTNKILKSTSIVEIVKSTIVNDPFISIRKLKTLIKDSINIDVSYELVRVAIKRHGFSKKKAKFFARPKDQDIKVNEFLDQRNFYKEKGYKFISIDETSFGRNGFETRGYCPIGEKLFVCKKTPRMTTTSVIAAANDGGWINYSETKGAVNTMIFLQFIKTLDINENTVLIMDNVAFHHSKVVKEYVSSRNAKILYSPPYSPWFNPIEMCFSIVKRQFVNHQDISSSFRSLNQKHFQAFFSKSLNCRERF